MSAPTTLQPLPAHPTTGQQPAPAPGPRVRHEPARRLSPAPGDRTWRRVLTALGATLVALALLALAGVSLTSWAVSRGYEDVPTTYDLGTPDSLTVTSRVADLQVVSSSDVQEVTLALVEDGTTTLPAADDTARARVEVQEGTDGTQVEVSQPGMNRFGGLLDEHRELLLLVPESHVMGLELASDVGGISVGGEYSSLGARSDVGDIRLSGVSAPDGITVTGDLGSIDVVPSAPVPGGITVTASVGDVSVQLPRDAEGDLTVRADVGQVEVSAPGDARRVVQASSDVGTVTVDPSLLSASGESVGTVTVTSGVGDISVRR